MKHTIVLAFGRHSIEFYWLGPAVIVCGFDDKARDMLDDLARNAREVSRKFRRAIDCNLAN
jgi:hypothetical protein